MVASSLNLLLLCPGLVIALDPSMRSFASPCLCPHLLLPPPLSRHTLSAVAASAVPAPHRPPQGAYPQSLPLSLSSTRLDTVRVRAPLLSKGPSRSCPASHLTHAGAVRAAAVIRALTSSCVASSLALAPQGLLLVHRHCVQVQEQGQGQSYLSLPQSNSPHKRCRCCCCCC